MEKLINDFKISFTKGDTYAIAVKFKNIAEDLRVAYFTVKESPDDAPLIQKALGAGISKIDDREYKKEKTYKVQIQASDTADLEANVQYLYDLQVTLDNVVKTVLSGVFVVTHSVTGVTSTTTATLDVLVDDEVVTEVSTTSATNGIEYEQDPVACGKIGELGNLTTEHKGTLVGAINEVLAKKETEQDPVACGKIGELGNLSTNEKGTVVGAVNEVVGNVGNMNNLNTTEKGTLVGAINEINARDNKLVFLGDAKNSVGAIATVKDTAPEYELLLTVGDESFSFLDKTVVIEISEIMPTMQEYYLRNAIERVIAKPKQDGCVFGKCYPAIVDGKTSVGVVEFSVTKNQIFARAYTKTKDTSEDGYYYTWFRVSINNVYFLNE